MAKKIMTLDSLYKFFVEQDTSFNFSSKNSGTPIVVTSNGSFTKAADESMPGMLKLKLKNCHIDTNRNGSHISKENMEKAMPTLKYRPILAYIHELPDGTKDFYAHNMDFVEDENGDAQIVYLEKQVGCFTADDPWLEYDEEMDKTYVMAYAVIPENAKEEKMKICGRNMVLGLPAMVEIDAEFASEAIKDVLKQIMDTIKVVLERTPPELGVDMIQNGIYLTGGSSQLKNFDLMIHNATGIKVVKDEDPEKCIARGLARVINEKEFRSLTFTTKEQEYN